MRVQTKGMHANHELSYILRMMTYITVYLHQWCVHTLDTYIHTYMHAYIRTYIHTYVCTYVHTYVRTYVHTYIYMYIKTHGSESCGQGK